MKRLEEVFRSIDQKNDFDDQQEEEILLPGFRFHPTDEELVGFYLRRKVQQKRLCIELIKQLDIYKFDPWDLPKMSGTGENELYFYSTRERKYPNSTRPNRVAVAGFWKATGIDKPIYSSNNGRTIIGLKKTLVFYKGRAAKAFKTEWMMHEFRLPTANNNVRSNEDFWTICRVFKKSAVVRKNLQHMRPMYIPSGNCIGFDSIIEELPSNETENQTSSSSNVCNNNSLTNDQCCSTESHPPEMTGLGKINENSGDDDIYLTEKSASFQSLEMSHNYFNRDEMTHFKANRMQEQVPPHTADFKGYRPLCVYDKIHQLNFSYENHQQACISGRYADSQENMTNRLSQRSSSQNYSSVHDYMMP